MNNMEQLQDIKGLAEVSFWPLATGWWAVIAASVLALILLMFLNKTLKQRRRPNTTWLKAAGEEWHSLQDSRIPAHARLKGLAVLLRRIAIQQYGRTSCASLYGEEWLNWLTVHDPAGFNWADSGELLVRIAYMPPDAQLDESQVGELASAVQRWIRA